MGEKTTKKKNWHFVLFVAATWVVGLAAVFKVGNINNTRVVHPEVSQYITQKYGAKLNSLNIIAIDYSESDSSVFLSVRTTNDDLEIHCRYSCAYEWDKVMNLKSPVLFGFLDKRGGSMTRDNLFINKVGDSFQVATRRLDYSLVSDDAIVRGIEKGTLKAVAFYENNQHTETPAAPGLIDSLFEFIRS